MNKKNTLNYPKSAAMGFFWGTEAAMVNEPSEFEPLKFYCTPTQHSDFFQAFPSSFFLIHFLKKRSFFTAELQIIQKMQMEWTHYSSLNLNCSFKVFYVYHILEFMGSKAFRSCGLRFDSCKSFQP